MPNASAIAALASGEIHPFRVLWLDVATDPVRATTAPYSITFSGTGDSDLDGWTYEAISHEVVNVSPVSHRDDGADTVTVTVSGLIGIDTSMMNLLGNKANFQGRVARLWMGLLDTSLNRIDTWAYYTGYMSAPVFRGDRESQTVEIQIESYLASLSEASNRTYLDQKYFDSGDDSAAASIAIANGRSGNGLATAPALSPLAQLIRDRNGRLF